MAKPRPRKRKKSKKEEKDRKELYFSMFIAFLLVFSIFAMAYSSGFIFSSKKHRLPENQELGKLSSDEKDFILSNRRAILEIVMPDNCTSECERVYGDAVELAREFSPLLYVSAYRLNNLTEIRMKLYTPINYHGVDVDNITVAQEILCNITYPKPRICILNELFGS